MNQNNIGFMQGRLCDPINGLIQAFPISIWEKEFKAAEEIGINLMEWTLDTFKITQNPLLTEIGRAKIKKLKNYHNLQISSLTGDCFMQNPFWKAVGNEKEFLQKQFLYICEACYLLDIRIIVIPIVDNGAIENITQEKVLLEFLLNKFQLLKSLNLKIAFESEMPPNKLKTFISQFPSGTFGINYDTGNSASMGFNPIKEFSSYGNRIFNVHIKDRLLHGHTVKLTEGNTDFDCVFQQLRKINYSGNLILQTARAKDDNHALLIKQYMDFVKELIQKNTVK